MSILKRTVDTLFVLRFLRLLTMDWKDTDAYALGIIDDEGNLLKTSEDLKTSEEKSAYTILHRLVWKIKRLLNKLPFGRSRLVSYATALWFLKEEYVDIGRLEDSTARVLREDYGMDDVPFVADALSEGARCRVLTPVENLEECVVVPVGAKVVVESIAPILGVPIATVRYGACRYPVPCEHLCEEMTTAAIANAGKDMPLGNVQRRERFMGATVFDLDCDKFHKCLRGKHPRHKYNKYVGQDQIGEEIRQFGRSNPKEGIIVRNKLTREMVFLKRPKR